MERLVRRNDLDALQWRADTGDDHASYHVCRVLAARGAARELWARGDDGAAERLVPLLAVAGDVDGLCREIDAGTYGAAGHLAVLLDERGKHDLAANLRRYGMTPGRPASTAAIAPAPDRLPEDAAAAAG